MIKLLYHTFNILACGSGMGATRMRLGAPGSRDLRLKLRIASGMHIETTKPRTKREAWQQTDIGIVPFRPARFTTSVSYQLSAITGPSLGEKLSCVVDGHASGNVKSSQSSRSARRKPAWHRNLRLNPLRARSFVETAMFNREQQ